MDDAILDDVLEAELQIGVEESDEELFDDDTPLLGLFPDGGGRLEKVADFYEEVVPALTDSQFREQFRLSRTAVDAVLEQLQEQEEDNGRNCDTDIPLEKKLLVCLWYLGSVISFRKVAMVFGMALGAAWGAVDEVVRLLVGLRETSISFPSKQQLSRVMQRFANKGFPGAIGAVDGSHIQICRPPNDEHAYVNRKHVHAINLMAVSDDQGKFLDVCIGWPGSVHDSRVFKNSPLGLNLESEHFRNQALPENSHLIGDAAFQLSTFLVTPFRESQLRGDVPGEPTVRDKRAFNARLSGARAVIEHAFGMLKGRFRRLGYVETKTVEKAVDITCAACVLHNMCFATDQWPDAAQDQAVDDDGDEADGEGPRVATDGAAAVQKRLALVRQVCNQ